jgi:hypothetical protein
MMGQAPQVALRAPSDPRELYTKGHRFYLS